MQYRTCALGDWGYAKPVRTSVRHSDISIHGKVVRKYTQLTFHLANVARLLRVS